MRTVLVAVVAFAFALSGCASTSRPGATASLPATMGTPPTTAAKPTLIVVLVVDQMRTDYLERAQPLFTSGLKRLTTGGAWFKNAAFPYMNTITCAGHSTIGTGAFPYRHGMVLNAWWDRKASRSRACTADTNAKNIGYGSSAATGGESAASLLVPTLSDQVRERAQGRIVAMSLKARSAITLAGSHPTSVVWFDDRAGWTTSAAFTPSKIGWLAKLLEARPASQDAGAVWNRVLPDHNYSGPDAGAGERYPQGWTAIFPHTLRTEPGYEFNQQWQRSPFADAYLGRVAAGSVDALGLGKGPGTDLLAVSFSALDLVGHQFGPASHEVQDVVLRLDHTIGALLDHLDAAVGRGRYLVALSADHGVAAMPEQSGGGRLTGDQVLAAVDRALVPFFGPGKYGVHSAYTDIYLAPGVLDKLKQNPAATTAVRESIQALPGIAHAFRSDEISAPEMRTANDPVKRAAALSYYPPRSGDLIVVPQENWMLSASSATTHGTLYSYDQRVPVLFYGPGVPAGNFDTAATPADIAPTLAALAGIAFDRTDGNSLLTAPLRK